MDRYGSSGIASTQQLGGVGTQGAGMQNIVSPVAPSLHDHVERAIVLLGQLDNMVRRHERLNGCLGYPMNAPNEVNKAPPAPESLVPRLGRVLEDIQNAIAGYDHLLSRTEQLLGAKL